MINRISTTTKNSRTKKNNNDLIDLTNTFWLLLVLGRKFGNNYYWWKFCLLVDKLISLIICLRNFSSDSGNFYRPLKKFTKEDYWNIWTESEGSHHISPWPKIPLSDIGGNKCIKGTICFQYHCVIEDRGNSVYFMTEFGSILSFCRKMRVTLRHRCTLLYRSPCLNWYSSPFESSGM